jgi:hypothetical protein
MSDPDFDVIRNILRPWLGEVRPFNLPSNPGDIVVWIDDIAGQGFRSLEWQKNNAYPDWAKPGWLTPSGVTCPRCQTEIQALLKSHKTRRVSGTQLVSGAPYVFCRCIRLHPSRLPRLEFFTTNWGVVLEALSFFEQFAAEAEAKRQRERGAWSTRTKATLSSL